MKTYRIPKNEITKKIVEEIGEEYYHEGNNHYDVQYSDPSELFDLATDIAKAEYREKPEEFFLPTVFIPFLKEAIKQYEKESMIRVTTFTFKEEGEHHTKIIVEPTNGHCLFAIYTKYGKLVCNQ